MRRPAAILAVAVLALAGLPAAPARAQGGGPGAGPGRGPWAGPPDAGDLATGPTGPTGERMEKRMRLARSLGLAEALDLDEAEAARMNAVMSGFDARRKVVLQQIRGDVRLLRDAARVRPDGAPAGNGPDTAAVEGAVQRIFDARVTLVGLDREMFQALAKGLTPEKEARMALFFAQFRQRFGMEILEKRR
jgi:Spy/CpxP family protein refolding chaperone